MEFTKMRDELMKNFEGMTKDESHLFQVDLDKDELWNIYLNSFPAKTNEIYRKRTLHDCSCCRHFIRSVGNVVKVKDQKITTIWDFDTKSSIYQPVMDALAAYVKAHAVSNVYLADFSKQGTKSNFEQTEDGTVIEHTHFYLELPSKFVAHSSVAKTGEIAQYREAKTMFQEALETITEDTLLTVKELIDTNAIYKGQEFARQVNAILEHKRVYEKLETELEKELYAWETAVKLDGAITRIKSTAIGELLFKVSAGDELDAAVRKYEAMVAPSNYMRSTPIFTQQMLLDAQKKIEELGYMESLGRRFAKLDDITINNILFANRNVVPAMADSQGIFEEMMKFAKERPKVFSKTTEISLNAFVENVLPTVSEVELYLENKHAGNMVSLIAPANKNGKSMFKWKHNFSWAYAGNVTDSFMKGKVKQAGGIVDGVLCTRCMWNENGKDNADTDWHVIEPSGEEIYFGHARKPTFSRTGGQLDVDVICPNGQVAVENIVWTDKARMKPGVYKFFVHQYSGNISGFKAEIEFDGKIYQFHYDAPVRSGQKVDVAEVTLDCNGNFSIKELIPSTTASKEVWGLTTNTFVPVSVVMYSPNYWDEQIGIGNKHVFFMLKDCVNPETPNGFYNEFLNRELLEHRKVMEAMGEKLKVQACEDQLSGVGFSTTKHDAIIVKVKGNTERIFKVMI